MTICRTGDENTIKFSQVAYSIRFYPWLSLRRSETRLIVWSRTQVWTKKQVLDSLSEDHTEIYYPGEGAFKVKWVFNNIPTEEHWNKVLDSQKLILSFRISPALQDETRIVLLELLPNYPD